MARRPKTSPLEDFVGLVALMPWWACVGLASLSYLVLSAMARPVVMTGIQPSQVGQVVTHAMFQGLAMVGQFVVPVLCLAAAAVSATKRQQRRSLVASVAQGRAPDALDGMTWQEFELLVGEAFRLQGYEVTELGGEGPDGGVDLVLRKGKEKFLVQCKQWKALKVGVAIVRELYGVMAAKGATGGFVVTSGSFTEEAIAFASGRNVRLVDGPKLFGLIQQATAANGQGRNLRKQTSQPKAPPAATMSPSAARVLCPVCSAGMVQRVAKRGDSAGSTFWGCGTFPDCRGTRSLDDVATQMSTANLHDR